jgi:hypothetical protein
MPSADAKTKDILAVRRRHAERRRLHRRRKFVVEAASLIDPELLSGEEAIALFCGSFAEGRRVLKIIRRRQAAMRQEQVTTSPSSEQDCLPVAPRPIRVLSRLNRSVVFPALVPKERQSGELSIFRILANLRESCRHWPAHRLLDALATASGLSWEACREILVGNKLVIDSFDQADMAATRAARAFWEHYEKARMRYRALQGKEDCPRFRGDWGYFESAQLESLLPGIIIPARLRRDDYLTNYVVRPDCDVLDVYAGSTRSPLFQHRFLNQFNPLFFGKPRLNQNHQ